MSTFGNPADTLPRGPGSFVNELAMRWFPRWC
jgi:hypothetical protein